MKINVSSLGCRLNQSEIQSVITALRGRGHIITARDDADVFIVNSCKVTLTSERKTRQLLYRAEKAARPGAMIILTGCCAGVPEIRDGIIHVPNDYKHLIPDILDARLDINEISASPPSPFVLPAPTGATTTRVSLKIQDGCDNFCSYCVIPYTRGGPKSKPAEAVRREFVELLDAGYREIVLTGVMIGKYDGDGTSLAGLVSSLLETPGEFRIHLTSISAAFVDTRLIDLMAHDRIVKHMNLSLQSGSDRVLGMMKRGYTAREYMRTIEKIKSVEPDFNFTTDVIVGFPGETESDFGETLGLVREAGFSKIHTFRYSPRPGTASASVDDDVPDQTKKARSEAVIGLGMELKRRYYARFDGRESVFLSERSRGGETRGFNQYYVPVEIDSALRRNRFYRIVTVPGPDGLSLRGALVETERG